MYQEILFDQYKRYLEAFSYHMLSQATKEKYYEIYRKFQAAENEARYYNPRRLHRIVSTVSKDDGSDVISYNADEQKQAEAKICEVFDPSAFDGSYIGLGFKLPENVKFLPLEQSKISLVSETEIYCRSDVNKLPQLTVAIIRAQIPKEFNVFEILNDEVSFFDNYRLLLDLSKVKVRLYKCADFPGDVLRKEIEEQKKKEDENIKHKGLDIF